MATTTRGLLWELLAPIVRWPMYSPKRLVAVLVGLTVAVFVIGKVSSDPLSVAQTAASSISPTVSSTVSPAATSSTEASDPVPTSDALQVARAFVKAWAQPQLSPNAWWRQVSRYTDEGFGQALGSTNPAQVPATRLRSVRLVSQEGDRAEVNVRTDGPTVRVLLVKDDSRWQVVNLLPSSE
jgi:hypothetical protein